jgi:ATP-dependent DNA helicase DinG
LIVETKVTVGEETPAVTPPPTNPYAQAWYYTHPPREQQLQVLDFVAANPDAKVLAADCPTGVGKSAICTTLANAEGGTILTPQKILQDQYLRDWPSIPILKGANAYTCRELVEDKAEVDYQGCDIGQMRHKCKDCPYRHAKEKFKAGRMGVTNYAFCVASMSTPKISDNRVIPYKKWLLLDECHNTEEALVRAAEVKINYRLCHEQLKYTFPHPQSLKDAQAVASKAAELARQRLIQLRKEADELAGKAGKMSAKAARLDRQLSSLVVSVNTMLDDRLETEWIHAPDWREKEPVGFTLRPLFANGLFARFLLPLADRFFMTSATILNGDLLSKWLGIDPNDFSFLSVDSPFPVDNRPVWVQPVASMAHSQVEASVPRMARAIARILSAYPKDKGIIHTSSFKLSYMLSEALRPLTGRILTHDSRDREQVLARHLTAAEPTVLMSPSMFEGVDLKDDLSRFTIIPKVPYPNLGDPWVKRRMQLDEEWYAWQTMKSLIQGVGRSVRSESDHADAYILDSCFGNQFWNRWRHLAPRWFRRSIVQSK